MKLIALFHGGMSFCQNILICLLFFDLLFCTMTVYVDHIYSFMCVVNNHMMSIILYHLTSAVHNEVSLISVMNFC